ncbi:hypothetical protein IE077_003243 [Cardiosporidium cionae]|uniref:Uncharacterized protein n=1 Tax=Cardiosporidium cionae TaxID=476202 RepID=A0ABQ7JFJ5_9APIC|nr:hypothetical protein IE077_003243 [Cardiosporidium cionae]|eukprot:KAF8822645.1 hypothetical protein IE077_003243 [Cardiosporidium cionae]
MLMRRSYNSTLLLFNWLVYAEFNPQLAIEKATLNFSINPLRKLSSIEAEEYSFLDTEEFDISVERDDSSNTPGIRKEAHPAKTLPMPLMKPMIWTDISAGVFFLLILLYAMKGKADNKRMVDSWVKAFAPILAENFAARGFKDTYVRMRKWHQYEVFASGRRNCRNMHLAMNCIPRQCIWRHRLLSLIQKTEDVISIEITLDTLDTVTFALCRKRELNQVLNEYKELKTHCKVWKGELDHNFCVVAETSEVVEQILQSPPMKLFQSNSIYIDLIYISDRASEKNKRDSSKLCVVLKAPSIQKSMELQPLFRAVMALVDFAVNIRIPDKVRNNLKNKRNAIDTEAKMNSEDYQEVSVLILLHAIAFSKNFSVGSELFHPFLP